ncbi:MAG: hypothetical protein ACE361_23505 [Aureliella sp.]
MKTTDANPKSLSKCAVAGFALLLYVLLFPTIRHSVLNLEKLEPHMTAGYRFGVHRFPNAPDYLVIEDHDWQILDLKQRSLHRIPIDIEARDRAFLGTTSTNQIAFRLSEVPRLPSPRAILFDVNGHKETIQGRCSTLVDSRYLSRLKIGDTTVMQWFDLESPQKGWQTTALEWSEMRFLSGLHELSQTPYFYCLYQQHGEPKPPVRDHLVVYEMTPTGPVIVSDWPIVRWQHHPLYRFVCSMSLDGKSITIRRPLDGKVTSRIPLKTPASWAAANGTAASIAQASENLVSVEGAIYIIGPDGTTRKPTGNRWTGRVDGDQSIVGIRLNQRTTYLLKTQGKNDIALEFPHPEKLVYFNFNDPDTIVALDSTLTTYRLSRTTGKVLSSFTPFFWPRLTALGTLILVLIWYLAWCRFSARIGWPAWIDQSLLGLLILAALTERLSKEFISSNQYATEWMLAAMFVWSLLASITQSSLFHFRRTVLAAMIPFGFTCFLLVLLKFNAERIFYYWGDEVYQSFAIRATGIFLLLCIGIAILKPNKSRRLEPVEPDREDRQQSVTLPDLFILTAVIAGVYAYLTKEQRDDWAASLALPQLLHHAIYVAIVGTLLLTTFLSPFIQKPKYWRWPAFFTLVALAVWIGSWYRVGVDPRLPQLNATIQWTICSVGLTSIFSLFMWPVSVRQQWQPAQLKRPTSREQD